MIKKVIVAFISIFLLIALMDLAFGTVLKYYYFKQESGLQYRTTYAIEQTKAEVLIFGSSRANHHYHPVIFENELNLTYYNAGRDGSDLLYHTAVLNAVLKRYTPKLIILDFDAGQFTINPSSYDRLSSLLPYYGNHPEMQSIIDRKSKFEHYKLFSTIYPYNSMLFTIAVGNTEYNKTRKGDMKGYVALNRVWNEPLQQKTTWNETNLDTIKIGLFKQFIEECNNRKIKLQVVCSPFYVKYTNEDKSIEIAKSIAKQNNISFLDYTNNKLFLAHPAYFADMGHLNDKGARIFSNILTTQLKLQ